VLVAILGVRTELHCLSMSSCHHLSKGWMRGASRGSRGGLWTGHGSLLGGALPWLNRVDGHIHCSFVQIRVGKRLSMNYSMYLCLCPTKQYSPNKCGTWLIVNAYVFKIAQPPMFVLLCFLSTLCTFLVLFRYVLLQIVKHQNLWKLLVLKPYV